MFADRYEMLPAPPVTTGQRLKTIAANIGFFVVTPLVVAFTALEIATAPARLIIGAFKNSYTHPMQESIWIWKLVWRHLKYLYRLCSPTFRQEILKTKLASQEKLHQIRTSLAKTKSLFALEELELVDAWTFFKVIWDIAGLAMQATAIMQAIYVTILGIVSFWGVHTVYTLQYTALPPTPHQVVPYQPQVADMQDKNFGPWDSEGAHRYEITNKDFRNLAIIDNTGTIKFSPNKVGVLNNFTPLKSSLQILNPIITKNGQIEFRDPHKQTFTVNPYQVFLVENYSSEAFFFNERCELFATPLENLTVTKRN